MKTKNTGNINFASKIIVILALQVISVHLILSQSVFLKILGIFLFGIVNAHSIQVLHQCVHSTGFNNKILNDIAGYILGLMGAIDFKLYRKEHFKHHKYLGTSKDIEFFGFEKFEVRENIYKVLPFVFGMSKYTSIIKSLKCHDKSKKHASIRLLLFIVITSGLLATAGYSELPLYWCLSLILVTEPIHFLIEIPEHYGCKNITSEKYQNTRTIRNASIVSRWFTNWNNFHVEHHLYQWVLPEDLAEYHDEYRSNHYNPKFKTYLEFYVFFFKDIFSRGAKV